MRFIHAWAVLLLVAGCTAEERASLGKLQDTYQAVQKEYPKGIVKVNLVNDRLLIVTVANSGIVEAERAARARRSARTALVTYEEPVGNVRVDFVSHKGVGITVTRTLGSYSFTPAELSPEPQTTS